MGFWGTKLYQNDYTLDIKDAFVELIQRKNINETTAIIYNDFYDEDPNYEPLFWYAISDVQKEYGFLDDITLKKALEWIDREGGINLWETKKQKENWITELSKLKIKLLDNTIPIKKIKKKEKFNHHPWEIGDLVAYKFHSTVSKKHNLFGKYIVFQKIENCLICNNIYADDEESTFSKVIFFNKIFDQLPKIDQINTTDILPFVSKYTRDGTITDPEIVSWYKKNIIIINHEKEYNEKYFYVLGNAKNFPSSFLDNHYGDLFLDHKFEDDIIHFLEIWME